MSLETKKKRMVGELAMANSMSNMMHGWKAKGQNRTVTAFFKHQSGWPLLVLITAPSDANGLL